MAMRKARRSSHAVRLDRHERAARLVALDHFITMRPVCLQHTAIVWAGSSPKMSRQPYQGNEEPYMAVSTHTSASF